MRHARSDYERFQDPAGLIPEEEPVFLLRGQDALAAGVVREYAHRAEQAGASPELIQACLGHADRMDEWTASIKSKIPDL